MNDLSYHVKTGLIIPNGFKVGNGLKQDGLVSNFFNIAL